MRIGMGWLCVLWMILLDIGAAQAETQGNVGVTAGVVGRGSGGWWEETRAHLGIRGDAMFGRKSNRDWGIGPYGELQSALDDLSFGGGASVLAPVHEYLPVVLSAGGYGRWAEERIEPGATLQAFWGTRSYNYHSWYIMAAGLTIQTRMGLGSSKERAIVIGVHIDGQVLALPGLIFYEWLSGGTGK